MNQDNFNRQLVVKGTVPIAKTATFNDTGQDLSGFESVTCYIFLGIQTNTVSVTNGWTVKLQESDALGSGYADVAATDLIAPAANLITLDAVGDDSNLYAIAYKGSSRYIRLVTTAVGTPGSTPMCTFYVKGHPRAASTGQSSGP